MEAVCGSWVFGELRTDCEILEVGFDGEEVVSY
jgi:hypothetical protein